MSELPDDAGFDAARGEDEAPDPDTTLILEYLSNRLGAEDAHRLEDRARTDKQFRCKLADIVLLKGLVMLALEKNPGPQSGQCRRTRGLFLDYLKGRTSPKKTAILSRHLEECFECELAFEKFQSEPSPDGESGADWGFPGFRSGLKRARGVVYTAVVAVAIAAGAFGVMGILSSGAASHRGRPISAAGPESHDGLFARPGEVRSALDSVTASADGSLDVARLTDLVEQILDGGTVKQRGDVYLQLVSGFRNAAEPVLWALAAGESDVDNRAILYGALVDAPIGDERSLDAAARRELERRSRCAIRLLVYASEKPNATTRRLLEDAFTKSRERDELWSQVMRLYPRMAGNAAVERHLSEVLADSRDSVRAQAVLARSSAGQPEALSLALDLLASEDETAQECAAIVIARQGARQDMDRLVARPWAAKLKPRILTELKKRPTGAATIKLPPD